jgi:hypothetical protein
MVKKFALATLLVTLGMTTAQAGTITGSIVFGTSQVTLNGGSDLSSATSLQIDSFAGANSLQAIGSGDYSVITPGAKFDVPDLVLASLAGFTISNSTYGTFTSVASDGPYISSIINQNANFLDIFLIGTFVPAVGGPLDSFDPSQTSVRLSFNQSGSSVGVTITLNSPPAPAVLAPEPGTMALAFVGLGVAGLARLRKSSK